jgi:hypothetical protein
LVDPFLTSCPDSAFPHRRHPGDLRQLADFTATRQYVAMRALALLPIIALSLAGCAASVGAPGPMGPAGVGGPPGPQGPANAGPHRLALLRTAGDIAVPDNIDVVIVERRDSIITLPLAQTAGQGRVITIRALDKQALIKTIAPDTIDTNPQMRLEEGEMLTVISDGDRRWIIISSSDL